MSIRTGKCLAINSFYGTFHSLPSTLVDRFLMVPLFERERGCTLDGRLGFKKSGTEYSGYLSCPVFVPQLYLSLIKLSLDRIGQLRYLLKKFATKIGQQRYNTYTSLQQFYTKSHVWKLASCDHVRQLMQYFAWLEYEKWRRMICNTSIRLILIKKWLF